MVEPAEHGAEETTLALLATQVQVAGDVEGRCDREGLVDGFDAEGTCVE